MVDEESIALPSTLSSPLHACLHALCHTLQMLPVHRLRLTSGAPRGRGQASEQAHVLPLASATSNRLPLLPVMRTETTSATAMPVHKTDDKGALADLYGKLSNHWFAP